MSRAGAARLALTVGALCAIAAVLAGLALSGQAQSGGPNAVSDQATATGPGSLDIFVLTNDVPNSAGNRLRISGVQANYENKVVVNQNSTADPGDDYLVYTAPDPPCPVSFIYGVTDQAGISDTASVYVEVEQNTCPPPTFPATTIAPSLVAPRSTGQPESTSSQAAQQQAPSTTAATTTSATTTSEPTESSAPPPPQAPPPPATIVGAHVEPQPTGQSAPTPVSPQTPAETTTSGGQIDAQASGAETTSAPGTRTTTTRTTTPLRANTASAPAGPHEGIPVFVIVAVLAVAGLILAAIVVRLIGSMR